MKRYRRLLLPCILAAFLIGVLFLVAYAATNHISNPHFNGSTDWITSGSNYDGSVGHDNPGSMKFSYNAWIRQDITITPTGIYSYCAWSRGRDALNTKFDMQLFRPGDYSRWIANYRWNESCCSWIWRCEEVALDSGTSFRVEYYGYSTSGKGYIDDVSMTYSRAPVPIIENNLVANGEFISGLDGWSDYNGGSVYNVFRADEGYGEIGLASVDAGAKWIEHSFTIDVTGTYTYGMWVNDINGSTVDVDLRIYEDGGGQVDALHFGYGTGIPWTHNSELTALDAGDYTIRVDPDNEAWIDVVYVMTETVEESEPPPEWSGSAWLYHPYLESDYWSHYQSYSETTWYGNEYEYYNVYRLRPGAYAWAIATLDIIDVGINTFGYYIDARINAWPDVPSTTVRYEGLQSVLVAPGQRIGAQCELGLVAPNIALGGHYHLLLYTEFDYNPINPHPYFGKYPNIGFCIPNDPTTGPIGPGAGEVASTLMPVCQGCHVPTTWTNFGRWIVWLECMIQNMFACWLVEWINGIIDVQILALQQAITSSDALICRFGDLMRVQVFALSRVDWTVSYISDGTAWLNGWIGYLVERYGDLAARINNLGYIIMSFSGDRVSYIYNEAGTNYWDVLVSIFGFFGNMVDLFTTLVERILDLLIMMLDLVRELATLLIMLLAGFFSGIGGGGEADSDLLAFTVNLTDLNCTPSGDFAGTEASPEKAACYLMTGLGWMNAIVEESALSFLPAIIIGVLAIGLVLWIMSQFREISAT